MRFFFEKIFVIPKYCPISNININTIVTDINNIKSNTDFDSCSEVYNINNNNYNNINIVVNNSNSFDSENININICDSENNGIVTNNIVNRLMVKIILILVIF